MGYAHLNPMGPCTPSQQTSIEAKTATIHAERQFVIDNLVVRIHFINVMIRWTGLAPWEFENNAPPARLCRSRT